MNEHTNFPAPRKPAPLEGHPTLAYRGQPVLTTELAAKAFGASERQLRDNASANSIRFQAGKHFFKVEGAELRALKDSAGFTGSVGSNAKSVTLWTERGIARHAKILETETAWAIFEELEDTYFKVRQDRQTEAVPLRQPQPKEIRLTHAYYMKLAAAAGLDTNSALISTNRIVRRLTGFDVLGEMDIPALAAPTNEAMLIPTDIGSRLDGIKAQAVNQMLGRFGYQVRMVSEKGVATWELTDKGRAAGGRFYDTERRHSDGTIVGQIKWPASIVDRLRADMLGEAH